MWEREETYRIYVTDALKALGNLNARYFDWVNDDVPVETRTSAEIIGGIKDKLRNLGGS